MPVRHRHFLDSSVAGGCPSCCSRYCRRAAQHRSLRHPRPRHRPRRSRAAAGPCRSPGVARGLVFPDRPDACVALARAGRASLQIAVRREGMMRLTLSLPGDAEQYVLFCNVFFDF